MLRSYNEFCLIFKGKVWRFIIPSGHQNNPLFINATNLSSNTSKMKKCCGYFAFCKERKKNVQMCNNHTIYLIMHDSQKRDNNYFFVINRKFIEACQYMMMLLYRFPIIIVFIILIIISPHSVYLYTFQMLIPVSN